MIHTKRKASDLLAKLRSGRGDNETMRALRDAYAAKLRREMPDFYCPQGPDAFAHLHLQKILRRQRAERGQQNVE